MIISHKHRFIFFAVPKTATHAVREALRTNLDPEDWEQQVLMGRQALPIPEIASIQHGHISVQQIRLHLSEEIWDGYFKFGFVRNPFDRFVSTCFFLNRDNPNFAANAVALMKDALRRPRFRQRILVLPQTQQLTDASGQVALDFTGRYENLQSSYDQICEQVGIPATKLPIKNASKHAGYFNYYDEELRGMVAELYASDLRTFDYEFPPS